MKKLFKNMYLEGKYVDKVVMGILKDEFKKSLSKCL